MIGEHKKTDRGFTLVQFKDKNGRQCSLQQSSAIGNYDDSLDNPGSSFVWLGVDDANPQIMKSRAKELGLAIPPGDVCGWIPYPIPEAVQLSTRMHLNREHAKWLIGRLQQWLTTGDFYSSVPDDGSELAKALDWIVHLERQLAEKQSELTDWMDTAEALYKAVPEAYRRGQLPEYGKRKPSDTVREVLAELEQQIADRDSALADCAIVLDVMAFSLVFAKLFVRDSEPMADACLSQIKCGLDAYLHAVGDDGLMSEQVKENSAASVDNQSEEV